MLSNFTLSYLVLGLITASISLALKSKPLPKGAIIEAYRAHFLLFPFALLARQLCHASRHSQAETSVERLPLPHFLSS
jgi:hypothetical protein